MTESMRWVTLAVGSWLEAFSQFAQFRLLLIALKQAASVAAQRAGGEASGSPHQARLAT
jgi:hypothetical protein